MVDPTDDNNVSAESLYQRYQKVRPSSVEQKHVGRSAEFLAKQGTTDFATQKYERYQTSRATKADATTKAILQGIEGESIAQLLGQNNQATQFAGAPDIESINVSQGGLLDKDLPVDRPAANGPTLLRRLAVPSIAAGILGILVIPLVMNSPDTPSIPDTTSAMVSAPIVQLASETVAFVDEPSTDAFGFSGSTNTAKTAFKSGVIITDLQLLIEAKQSASAGPFLKTMTSPPKVLAAMENLGAAISDTLSHDVVLQRLKELVVEVEYASDQSKQIDWYLTGRSIESIKIAAEHAMASSETKILEQTLALGANLDKPSGMPAVIDLLNDLHQIELTEPERFVQVSKILSTVNDIKLLMQ